LLKKVVEVTEVAKAEVVQLLIRNIGRTKHASLAVIRNMHPSSSCMKLADANDDDSASIVHGIKKLAKETKNLKKAFT
jgi:hypothetical protein